MVARRAKKILRPRSTSSLIKYGLSVSDWKKMLDSQGGRCKICGKGGVRKHLSVSHDHSIQRDHGIIVVDGLLCQRCNRGFGAFEYDNTVLRNAINHMRRLLRNRAKFEKEDKLNA